MTIHYAELPLKVQQCADARRMFVNIQKNDDFVFVLQYLEHNGYLTFFTAKDKLVVFPKYGKKQAVLSKFLFMTKPSCRNHIKLPQIKVMFTRQNRIYRHSFILTRNGLVTIETAYKNGIGGEYIYHIV